MSTASESLSDGERGHWRTGAEIRELEIDRYGDPHPLDCSSLDVERWTLGAAAARRTVK